MPDTVVIADDVTGANDIGVMYAKAGLRTLVYRYEEEMAYADCDVLIVDTDSRFDGPEEAARKVHQALAGIRKSGVRQYISKQCSVFRGNIGAEFDAMMDALGEDFAVVVLGFPGNGRTTRHQLHYVDDVLLADSQFRHDPVHPTTDSDLVNILQSQTARRVGAIHYEWYDKGEVAVRKELARLRQTCQYCIMDVRDNGDLKFLADIFREERMICGSSALSEYLARGQKKAALTETAMPERTVKRILCVAGSLTPQTYEQIRYVRESGYPMIRLDTRKLATPEERGLELARIAAAAAENYRHQSFLLVHTLNEPEQVAETKRLFGLKGYANTEIVSLVSAALAEAAESILRRHEIDGIIACGGDTADAICRRLKIRGMRVLQEIETGLPSCESVTRPHYRMVLKSGSFGSPAFIEKAAAALFSPDASKGD